MKKHSAILAIPVAFLLVLSTAWAEMAQHDSHGRHAEKSAHAEGVKEHHEGANQDEVFGAYFAITEALKQNSMDNVQANAKALAQAADRTREKLNTDSENDRSVSTQLGDVGTVAKSLSEKTDIKSAREEFGKLSSSLVEYQKKREKADSEKLHVFRCDMAKKVWLQEDTELGNPYYGPSMAKCRREID